MRRELASPHVDVRRLDCNPISRHSLMYFTTSSVLPVTEVSRPHELDG